MNKVLSYCLIFIFWLALIVLNYYIPRQDFFALISIYTALFGLYFAGFFALKKNLEFINTALFAGLIGRVLLLFAFPNFSDDFYRFYWDGLLLSNGISPFEHLPAAFMTGEMTNHGISGINEALFSKLNSPEYFTIYPPVCQFVFWISALIFPNSLYGAVVTMKVFMLLFELGSLYFIIRLLDRFKLPEFLALLYWLNPLVIIELTGNIHFEAAMICFCLGAVWFLVQNRVWFSATAMALAICSKLLPLIFLPFFLRRLNKKNIRLGFGSKEDEIDEQSIFNKIPYLRSMAYFAFCGIVCVLLFLPVMNLDAIQNLMSSVDLYFQKFEFNASVFYIIREIGFLVKGWDVIQTFGPLLGLLTFATIVILMLLEKSLNTESLFNMMMWALFIYLSFATIVHPWYVCPLIAFCIFTNFRFPVIWAILVPLTYYTYLTDAYHENLYLVLIEYAIVYLFIIYEFLCHSNQQKGFDGVCTLERNCFLKAEKGRDLAS